LSWANRRGRWTSSGRGCGMKSLVITIGDNISGLYPKHSINQIIWYVIFFNLLKWYSYLR
jgi:hypothetical protein